MVDIDFVVVFKLTEPIRTPGYVVVDESRILFVPGAMNLFGVDLYVGYQLDGKDCTRGTPVFLHSKMRIRQLGTIDEYLQDDFVQACLPRVTKYFRPEQGVLPVICVIECLRVDTCLDVQELARAVSERYKILVAQAQSEQQE